MPRFEIKNGARLAAAAGLGLTLALGAVPAVALANPTGEGEASLLAADSIVQIRSSEELKEAIENQEDGQTWILSAGTYELNEPIESSKDINKCPEGTKFAFPIWSDNLTIRGDGDVTITSSWDPGKEAGGIWSNQNFITVAGKGVTIEGVKLRGNSNSYYDGQCNKVIELVDGASDFTLKNATLLPITGSDGKVTSGSIYMSVADPGNSTIENVTMSSWISARSVKSGTVTISSVTQDFTNNTYAGYKVDGNYGWNPGVSGSSDHFNVDGLNIVVDNNIEFEQQLMTEQFKSGTTITLASDIELHNTLNINKIDGLVIDGQGHTITAASDFVTDTYGLINLVKPDSCSNITFKNVKMVATSDNKHVLDVYGSQGVVLDNVVLDHSDAGSGGAPLIINGSSVKATGPLTLVTGANSWYAANVDSKNGNASFTVGPDVVDEFAMTGPKVGVGIALESPAESTNCSTVILGDQQETSENGSKSSISKSVATVGDKSFSTLQDAFDAVKENGGIIDLTSDVVLDDSVDIPVANITINGNGHTVSLACAGAKGILGHMNTGVMAGTKLTVNNVHFKNTSGNQQGFAILLASNSIGTEVAANNCTFENLYSGVYVNPVTDTTGTPLPKVAVNNGTYVGTTWGYSVDTVSSQDAIAVGWDVAFTGNGDEMFAGESEVFAGNTFVLVDSDGTYDTGFATFENALDAVEKGQTIILNEDVELDGKLTIPADKGFSIDGNGHTMSLREGVSVDSGALIDVLANNVTISNLTVNAQNAKHGVQFYRAKDGVIEGCVINGGYFTAVNVNGSEATISNTILNPEDRGDGKLYANIEYGMGSGVTEIPSITVSNVTGSDDVPLVYVDDATMDAVAKNSSPEIDAGNKDAIAKVINGTLNGVQIYLSENGEGATSDKPYTPVIPPAQTGEKVNVEQPSDATIKVTPSRADKGDTVTVTVTPDEGREVASVTVTDEDGKAVAVKPGEKDGTWTFEMPDGPVTVTATTRCDGGELCPSTDLEDVMVGEWYHDAVDWAVANGVMSGYDDGTHTFGVSDALSRAHLAQVLYNQAGRPDVDPAAVERFSDCSADAWYAKAVAWCASEGIVSGYDNGTFGPADDVTREQLATMLWRQAGEPESTAELGFVDAGEISQFAREAVEWAVGEGIISGYDDGSNELGPVDSLERAQAAMIFMRMADK